MASTKDPTGTRHMGAQKIKVTCSCGRLIVGNAAKWSHQQANPAHIMVGRG